MYLHLSKISPPGRTVRLSSDPRRSPINPSNSQAVLLRYFSRFSSPPAICTRVPLASVAFPSESVSCPHVSFHMHDALSMPIALPSKPWSGLVTETPVLSKLRHN